MNCLISKLFGSGEKKPDKAAWAAAIFVPPPKHPEKISEELLRRLTAEHIFQDLRVINESLDIVQKTRYEDTKQGRIKLTLDRYEHLKTLIPFADDESLEKISMAQNRMKEAKLLKNSSV